MALNIIQRDSNYGILNYTFHHPVENATRPIAPPNLPNEAALAALLLLVGACARCGPQRRRALPERSIVAHSGAFNYRF